MATHDKSSESFVIFNNSDNYSNLYDPTNRKQNWNPVFYANLNTNEVNDTEIQPMEITKTSIYEQQNMRKFLQNNLFTDERKKEISFYQQGDDTETNDEVFKAIIKKDEKDENSELDSTNENESQYFRSSQKETKKAEIKDPGLKDGNHHQDYKEKENKSMKAGTFPKMSISDVEKNKLVKNI